MSWGEMVAVARGETGATTRRHRCFSPSLSVPSSSSPELLLPPPVPSSSTSLLRRRYVSSPRPLLSVADRPLASLPPPIDAPALGATLLPASPSHVGSSHLREEREYTNFHSWKGGPELSAPALLEPTKVPHNAQKSHIGADAGCAGNGLSGRTNARPGPWLSVTALLRFLGREAPC
jgi:hypothetical protein